MLSERRKTDNKMGRWKPMEYLSGAGTGFNFVMSICARALNVRVRLVAWLAALCPRSVGTGPTPVVAGGHRHANAWTFLLQGPIRHDLPRLCPHRADNRHVVHIPVKSINFHDQTLVVFIPRGQLLPLSLSSCVCLHRVENKIRTFWRRVRCM